MKPLTKRKRRASERGPVTATCQMCPYAVTGATWRPVKRLLATHAEGFHHEAAAA